MARSLSAPRSAATTHVPRDPWPVRANSKSGGVAPTAMVPIGTRIASDCAIPDELAQAAAQAKTAIRINDFKENDKSFIPSMRNLLDKRVSRRAWTADRLTGGLHDPVTGR